VPNPLGNNKWMWIPAGLLEGSENLEIAVHIYVNSKAQWETISNSGIQYEEGIDIELLYKLIHQSSFRTED
jgi:hypothetical protein